MPHHAAAARGDRLDREVAPVDDVARHDALADPPLQPARPHAAHIRRRAAHVEADRRGRAERRRDVRHREHASSRPRQHGVRSGEGGPGHEAAVRAQRQRVVGQGVGGEGRAQQRRDRGVEDRCLDAGQQTDLRGALVAARHIGPGRLSPDPRHERQLMRWVGRRMEEGHRHRVEVGQVDVGQAQRPHDRPVGSHPLVDLEHRVDQRGRPVRVGVEQGGPGHRADPRQVAEAHADQQAGADPPALQQRVRRDGRAKGKGTRCELADPGQVRPNLSRDRPALTDLDDVGEGAAAVDVGARHQRRPPGLAISPPAAPKAPPGQSPAASRRDRRPARRHPTAPCHRRPSRSGR
jgi:hypothetical protein